MTQKRTMTELSTNHGPIKKTVAAPHKKRKVVRSQQQALSHLAASVEQLASSAAKNQRLTTEADLKRDKMLRDFKRDEAQKNREHDIQMAQIFANAMMHSYRPPLLSNWLEYLNAKFQTSSESSFHNMLYLLLPPLLTIHRQHPKHRTIKL